MFDIEALEAAGFTKLLTEEVWAAGPGQQVPLNNYFLARGEVLITTEQNTTEQSPYGISTTVRYPEIAIIHHAVLQSRRVTCDASDTDLILALAEEVGADRKRATHG
jgi:hypothetical protein